MLNKHHEHQIETETKTEMLKQAKSATTVETIRHLLQLARLVPSLYSTSVGTASDAQ
jgi:hypothetical protein